MTITTLAPAIMQRRFTEVGRIRLGDKSEKGAPRKLTKFRITSAHSDVLARVADVYGGTVTPWADAPTGKGTQSELYVEAETLDVMVPPGQVLTQAFELWSGGGCKRRCNGVATDTGEPCVCPEDPEERNALAQAGKACKLTTRLSVWLPRIPGIGVWRLESHGWYAAMELPGSADLLSMASEQGRPIPATLRIASRVVKRDGKTNQFTVPQLDPAIGVESMFAVMRGESVPELAGPAPVAALPAAPPAPAAEVPALPAGEPAAPSPIDALLEQIKGLTPAQREHAKKIAADFGAPKLTPKALAENAELLDTLQTWVEVGASLPIPATAAPIDVGPGEPVSDQAAGGDDPERPF